MRLVTLCVTLILSPFGLQAQSAPLTSLEEARTWYIDMMRANGCIMAPLELRDALDIAFPYADPAFRDSYFMAVEASIGLVEEGLIITIGTTEVRYIGPNGC